MTSKKLDTKDWVKTRYVFGVLGCTAFAVVYGMRVNLSVAIVAMVNSTSTAHVVIGDECPNPYINSTSHQYDGKFNWNEAQQGYVLGSFFFGYILTQIPGGRLAEQYGGKYVLGYGVLLASVFTVLSPIAANLNFWLFILVRMIEGIGEGVTYPAINAMTAKWIPPLERSTFAAIVFGGANGGSLISLPLTGWLCNLEFLGGWPLAFYLFGGLGIVWFGFWMFFVYDSPEKHPRISIEEKLYILEKIGSNDDDYDPKDPIPWKDILTSLPVWAILVTQCGQAWAFYTQLTELPTYMQNVLHVDIENNALISAVPYLTSWVGGICFSICSDWLLSKGYLSPITSYRIFNSIAAVVSSIFLMAVVWSQCNSGLVTIFLGINGVFTGAIFSSNTVNNLALSPRYAGTIYGITNSAANICGVITPVIIGQIINGHETLHRWAIVFYLAVAINIGTNFFYLIFVSATEQYWSKSVKSIEKKKDLCTSK